QPRRNVVGLLQQVEVLGEPAQVVGDHPECDLPMSPQEDGALRRSRRHIADDAGCRLDRAPPGRRGSGVDERPFVAALLKGKTHATLLEAPAAATVTAEAREARVFS